jgi:hypothetical protein
MLLLSVSRSTILKDQIFHAHPVALNFIKITEQRLDLLRGQPVSTYQKRKRIRGVKQNPIGRLV